MAKLNFCRQMWVIMELMPFGALNEVLDKGWRQWVGGPEIS
jgi:hypothetical protein